MAVHAGKNGVVKVGSNSVAEVRNWSVDETGETTDGTAMGATWRTNVATLNSWSGSLTCWYDPDDTTGQGGLTVGTTVSLELEPLGTNTGDPVLSGSAIITAINHTASVDGLVEASFSFTGDGALTKGTQ